MSLFIHNNSRESQFYYIFTLISVIFLRVRKIKSDSNSRDNNLRSNDDIYVILKIPNPNQY